MQKSKCVCLFVYFNEIIWLIIMKVKKKSRSHKYHINRRTSRHWLTYTNKHKKCLSMMMLICIKQHPTNTWGSVYEKFQEHWGYVEKNVFLIKHKRVRQKTKTMKRWKSTRLVFSRFLDLQRSPIIPPIDWPLKYDYSSLEINRNCSKSELF